VGGFREEGLIAHEPLEGPEAGRLEIFQVLGASSIGDEQAVSSN